MHGLIGVVRTWPKHAGILLALGALLQFATLHAPAKDTPKRPRITGIDHIRLYVSDIDKSRQFYARLPGIREGGELCTGTSDTCFSIASRQLQTLELAKAPSKDVRNWLPEISFATDDLQQMRAYLIARGV